MRKLLSIGIVIAVAQLSAGGGSSPNTFSLNIQAENSTVSTGNRIGVKIVLTNTSDHDLVIRETMRSDQGEWDYGIEVTDAKGNPVGETRYGKERTRLIALLTRLMRTVKPGETLNGEIVLSKLFDLTVPGQYFVRVSRHAGDRDSGELIWSNKTNVTITSF